MNATLKSVSAQQLLEAYIQLNPQEKLTVTEDTIRIFNNWLTRYHETPEKALATQNWCGKVTTALFKALGLKQPRTKKDMLVVLGADMQKVKDTALQRILHRYRGRPIPTQDDWCPTNPEGTVQAMVMILPPYRAGQSWVVRTLVMGGDDLGMERDEDFSSEAEAAIRYDECVKEVNGWAIVSLDMLRGLGFDYA